MGDVPSAIDRYTDIPADVRARLKERMKRLDYDDLVSIRRDGIEGGRGYDPEIRDMYFGSGRVCHSVTRSRWTTDQQERGLVYCESGQCILVPTVCRNVSRITPVAAAAPPAAADAGGPPDELAFAPPGAGPSTPGDPAAVGPNVLPSGTPPGAPDGGGLIGPPIAIPTFPIIPGGILPVGPTPPITPVPEPQTWALWAAGLVALGIFRLRRRKGSNTTQASNGAR
ncbi:MAG: MHFG family PEP-CTERM protein [Proteobacteria bacterium]|nr:MHFG family PEP-CTERM protein [Pseudomonadota bacterium]